MTATRAPIEPELLSLDDLAARGFGKKSKIYAMVERGDFPRPIKIGGSTRWVAGELRDYIAAQIAGRAAK